MEVGARNALDALVVCGPTAAGKSELADALADALSEELGDPVPTVVVDSMQVYGGLERISNQARRRPAELVGVVPVTERWTMARHRDATEAIVGAASVFRWTACPLQVSPMALPSSLAPWRT